tara:strand:+ start:8 stop:1141 length:1134 start_codon:yes stop_codon:yes gene_type:complete
MKKILTLALLFCFVVAEDEFFEEGVNIGGYGEMHYTNSVDPDSDDDPTTKLDFHRWILFVNYNFTSEWSLKSELEIEHNMIGGSYGGYVELEQAYVNYHNAAGWGYGAGTMLISSGIINETHEPPTFLSVERPSYNSKVIPTTWFGNGAMVYGSFGDIHAKFVLHEDMHGDGMVSLTTDENGAVTSGKFSGLRGGRAKGYKSTAYHWTKNMSMHWTGMEGVNVGGSYTFGGAPTGFGDVHEDYVAWNLMEFHGQYDANNVVAAFEYGMVNFSHEAANTAGVDGGNVKLDDQAANGYYFHLGYNVASMMGWEDCKLVPWFGMENYDLNDLDDSDAIAHTKMGVTWWPTDKVSFKMDYDMKDDNDSKTNTLSMGVGYMF